ncbi:YolD-like family protein [Shouchella clausii]|uniref:YolD-like family protein n=1 Tax=Shouchella clausii TaxID=79880 RepID=UPI0021497855|nr:YolD-like family protein [Shouchella clausii]MCR1287678.1 YolD-like family protein [Shouchella clausii]
MAKEELYIHRGNLLWEGSRMMLPEHKQAWLELQRREEDVPLHGELDDDEWRELGATIMDALNHTYEVTVTYWDHGRYRQKIGTIDKLDEWNKQIKIAFPDRCEWLPLRIIKHVSPV